MTSTSYLRVYQPLSTFAEEDRSRWMRDGTSDQNPDPEASRRWLLGASLPAMESVTEGALVRKIDGITMVCPWRTRLRMLAGLLAFRGSLPEEVAQAFVPEQEARRAAEELEILAEQHPDVRSHILHANWHVPLRWFAAFDEGERILTEDSGGLRIRYETSLGDATTRLGRTLSILESAWIDDGVTAAVKELLEWLNDFPEEGLLELDYGSVATMFEAEELADDDSAAQVWVCLEALASGDVERASRAFGSLSDKWTQMRAREVVN